MKRLIDFAACPWPDILLRAGEPVNPLPARVRDLRIRSSAAATLDLRDVEEVFNLLEINDCPNLVEILCLPALVECTWILNCPALKRISAWGSTRTPGTCSCCVARRNAARITRCRRPGLLV